MGDTVSIVSTANSRREEGAANAVQQGAVHTENTANAAGSQTDDLPF